MRGRRRPGDEPEQVLFAPEARPGSSLRLGGSEADHARRSLRLRTGDPVWVVDGRGGRFSGRVSGLGKREIEVSLTGEEVLPVWPRRSIQLGAGVLRSTRMDTLVEKASELGVARLSPLVLRRSVARPQEDGTKLDRWHRLAVESLKQSRRAFLMEVDPPRTLEEFLEDLPPEPRTLWTASPGGLAPREAAERTPPEGPLVLVVGPEGGLAEAERDQLDRAGALPVDLGGHRLRAETAVLALVVAALTSFGELGAGSGPR